MESVISERLTIVMLLFGLSSTCLWGEPSRQTTNELIAEGIELGYNFDRSAFSKFDEVIRREPEHPRGYFLKATGFFWFSLVNPANESARVQFRDLSKTAIEKAENRLRQNGEDLDAHFFLGAASGNLGRFYALENRWLKAFWHGRRGKNTLLRIVELDPDYHDAFLGLGIYHYYTAVLPKVVRALSYIMGIQGDKELGLRELVQAATKGNLARTEARFFLGQLYHEQERDFEASQKWFDELVVRYPGNGLFRIYQAGNDFERGRYERVERSLRDLIEQPLEDLPIVESRAFYILGKTYAHTNRYPEAIEHFRRASAVGERLEELRDWAYAGSLFYEGECLEVLGDRDAALAAYRRVHEGDNGDAYKRAQIRIASPLLALDVAVMRWRAFRKRGKHREALETLLAAMHTSELDPEQYPTDRLPQLNYRMGETLVDLSDTERALVAFIRVLETVKKDDRFLISWTHFQMGRCYNMQGRKQEARGAFETALIYADDELKEEIVKIMGDEVAQ